MKYLNLLAFTSLIALAATDIPDELNSEELQNIPVDAVDEISDGPTEADDGIATIDTFLSEGEFKTYDGFLIIHQRTDDLERGDNEDFTLNQT